MQTIMTRYLPPTNTRGARIKVISVWGSRTYAYDHTVGEPHKLAFDTFLSEQNAIMAENYPDNQLAAEGGWWKLVAYADSLDKRGFTYIIK